MRVTVASPAVTRTERKLAQLRTARRCGERFSNAHPSEDDPIHFLKNLEPSELTKTEKTARAALLPATWQGAFARGWRAARS